MPANIRYINKTNTKIRYYKATTIAIKYIVLYLQYYIYVSEYKYNISVGLSTKIYFKLYHQIRWILNILLNLFPPEAAKLFEGDSGSC